MFDNLMHKFDGIIKKARGEVTFSEANVKRILRDVRLALLEADVNYKVVKDFTRQVKEKVMGKEVLESLSPAQHFVKIIHQEITRILGGESQSMVFSPEPPTVIMLVGLQGAGKTTLTAKLALYLRKRNKAAYLVPADVYRPAAIEQLKVLARQIDVPYFPAKENMAPLAICKQAVKEARDSGFDVVILDTAGRLHINEELMQELRRIRGSLSPSEILYVADSMTGQDAVTSAKAFDQELDVSGIVLTKVDGDARGGAALSIKSVVGKPIKFVSIGEKLNELEVFYPERMASRILGMGDMMSLIEKAQSSFDEKQAMEMQHKIRKSSFTLEDFYQQMQQIKKLGPLDRIMESIPGMNRMMNLKGGQAMADEKELKKIEAIILSMTPEERQHDKIIDKGRKLRIARGSGTTIADVNKLLKQFTLSRKMMKKILPFGKKGKIKDLFKLLQ